MIELGWNESVRLTLRELDLAVRAFKPKHWGARMQYDVHRGYNSYVISRNNRRIIYGSDTAMTDAFAKLNDGAPYDLAIMGIGAYDPWIWAHSTPEQAVAMADAAGARFIMPVHHQTFRLSIEPFREPIERFTRALAKTPDESRCVKSGRHCANSVRLAKKFCFAVTSGVEDSGQRTRLRVLALCPASRLFPDWEGRLQSRPSAG